MAIKIGDRIPSVTLKHLTDNGMVDIDTAEILGSGKVILFAVPGAYTPTCNAKHLPSFLKLADDFKAKGVTAIYCLAVNDPFVMKAWLVHNEATDIIQPLADGNGAFTRALGLTFDASAHSMGERAQRFAMVIEDGVVKTLNVEAPGQFGVSSGDTILEII